MSVSAANGRPAKTDHAGGKRLCPFYKCLNHQAFVTMRIAESREILSQLAKWGHGTARRVSRRPPETRHAGADCYSGRYYSAINIRSHTTMIALNMPGNRLDSRAFEWR
jgi:hypothetical protein